MHFDNRVRRVAGDIFLASGLSGVAAIAVFTAIHPAAAAAVVAAVSNAVTCGASGTNSCLSGSNTGSGIGILGTSNSGTGVRGSANTNYGVKGSSGTNYGVFGTSASGYAGIAGSTATRVGVFGYTTSNSSEPFDIGVEGLSPDGGSGVVGESPNGRGNGVLGTAGSGTGVYGHALGSGGTGGVFAGAEFGIVGSGAYPIILQDSAGSDVFEVDSAGNVYYSGSLITFAKTLGAANVTSFTAKMTLPTVEDTGTAKLSGGTAAVPLEPTFAASIEPSTGYRVFLTPSGDTRGLYVAAKTRGGFIVREAQGGRSASSFDYRIVATALGQAGQRMALMPTTVVPRGPRLAAPNRELPRP